MEEGYFRKLIEPKPILLDDGSPKIDFDAQGNKIFWMEIELEELGIGLRQISN